MDEKQRGFIIGSLVIFIGILLLLSNLDILNISSDITIGGILLLIGIALISFYFSESRKPVLLILGGVLGTIGLTVVVSSLQMIPYAYRVGISWTVFLWGLAAIFLLVFFINRSQLWSILVGGLFFIIGLVVGLNTFIWISDGNLWGIFLAGLGILFGLFFFSDQTRGRTVWAKYPAIGFISLAILVLYFQNEDQLIIRLILPVGLMLLGSYFLYNGFEAQKK